MTTTQTPTVPKTTPSSGSPFRLERKARLPAAAKPSGNSPVPSGTSPARRSAPPTPTPSFAALPTGDAPRPWSAPRHAVTVHAGFDLVFFGGALMFAAIVCAIWAFWWAPMLVLVLPFAASAGLAWWRWLSYRIVVEPRGLRIGRMLGGDHRIPFSDMASVRFLRVPQGGGRKALKVNWTADKLAQSLNVPFETPHLGRHVEGSPLQMWIERRGGREVRLSLDFLGQPKDIELLYQTLPHSVAPDLEQRSGPTQAMPSWW